MNVIQRIFNKYAKRFSLTSYPQWFGSRGLATDGGVTVSPSTALAINAVYVSAKIIGEAISSISFESIQRDGNKRLKQNDDIKYFMSVSPDSENGVTSSDYWKSLAIHLVTHGNSFSYINRNVRGRILSIKLLMPWDVTIYSIEGTIWYKTVYGMVQPDDLLHFKGGSWNGVNGLSPINEQSDLMNLAVKINEYGRVVYGKKPPAYISTESEIDSKQTLEVMKVWESQVTGDNLGGTPVLGGGMKYNAIPMNPADIEYIKTNNITDRNIYAMYRIPPTMAQEYENAVYNAEQQDSVFIKHTILPYLVNFEQEITLKLYPIANRTAAKPRRAKFNITSILRADFKTRSEGLGMMWERGVITKNEWRSLEDMNPADKGGDDFFVMVNMQREKDIDKNLENKRSSTIRGFELDKLTTLTKEELEKRLNELEK